MSEIPSALRDRILAQAKAEPAETVKVRTRRIYVYLAGGLLASVGLFLALGSVRAGERSVAYLFAVFSSATMLFGVFGALALRRGSAASAPTHRFIWSAIGLPIGWTVATFAWLAVWPFGGGGGSGHAPRHDVMCAVLSIAMGAGPLVALMLARKGTVFVASRWVGAALGAVSLTFGAFLMTLACPCAEAMHMFLGHVLPAALAGALLGAIGGGTILPFRPR